MSVVDRAVSLATHSNDSRWLLQPDKFALFGLCVIVLVAGASSILRAAQRPFWYDEIYTLALSRLDSFASVWSALQDAVDTNPPLYYVITRLCSQLPLPAEVSYRLPSTLGFIAFLICLYFIVRPIAGPAAGLISVLVPLTTPLYDPYAIEARPYALLSAFLAFALFCWVRSDRTGFALLFPCAIATLMSLHYYAVFLLAGFVVGEGIVSLRRRSFRLQVWLGLAVGIVPLVVSWPLLQAIRTYYAAGFWSKPELELIPQSYDALLFEHSSVAIGFAFVLASILAVGILRGLTTDLFTRRTSLGNDFSSTTSIVDPGLSGVLVVFLLSPMLMTIATKLVAAGMQDRYAMAPLVSAVAICTGIFAVRIGPRVASCLLAILLLAFGVNTTLSALRWGDTGIDANLAQYQVPPGWLESARERDLPIVVSDGVYYLTAYQYGSAEQRDRLMVVIDPPSALNYVNTDSVDRNLAALRRYAAVRVEDFQEFAQARSSFLLLSPHDANGDYFDWWARRLAYDGYSLRVEQIRNRQVLYLVDRS
jgi:4-amino-4-deoxy-L-arabinose transferase-like glycosyltransferase